MTGLPIDYYVLPTKNTVLHRISVGPDESIWFTELAADRIGTISVGPVGTLSSAGPTKKRKVDEEDHTNGVKKARN